MTSKQRRRAPLKEPPKRRGPDTILFLIASVVFVASVTYSWNRSTAYWGVDFAQLWLGGHVARSHGADIYTSRGQALSDEYLSNAYTAQRSNMLLDVIHHRERLATAAGRQWLTAPTATPFLYTLFAALPPRYDTAILMFRVLSLTALIGACALLAWQVGLRRTPALFYAAVVLVLFEPLSADQRVSNVNQVQLLLLAGYLALLARRTNPATFGAGALLGAAICLKPNVILVAPLVIAFWLARKAFRPALLHAAGLILAVLVLIVSTSLWFGTAAVWPAWLDVARGLASAQIQPAQGNMALFNTLLSSIAPALGFFAFTLFVLWHKREQLDERADLSLIVGVGVLLFLLTSTLVWLHYPLLALPIAYSLSMPRHAPVIRSAAVVSLALIAVTPWNALVQSVDANVWARVIGAGLIGLFATSMYALLRTRQP